MIRKRLFLANKQSLLFMVTNLGAKSIAAFTQLYAIFVFSRIYTASESSVIFLLFGYAIWFQVLEFGLAQTLQNRFNNLKSTADDVRAVVVIHYVVLVGVAAYVVVDPAVPRLLLPAERSSELTPFSIGMAVMVVSTNNLIIQRVMLIANRGLTISVLLIIQSLLAIFGLFLCQYGEKPDPTISILVYLAPQLLINLPIIFTMVRKLLGAGLRHRLGRIRLRAVCSDAVGFWLLNVLSSIFLGADYYFSAHYLSSEQILPYHFATRVYFLSFVAYFAYIQHQSRRLTPAALNDGAPAIRRTIFESVTIGLLSVAAVYVCVLSLDHLRFFEFVTSKELVSPPLMLAAFAYFSIRVLRDVGMVVLGNVGEIYLLYGLYIIEIALGLPLLSFTAERFGGVGIFLSMAFTCGVSTTVLIVLVAKIISSRERRLA